MTHMSIRLRKPVKGEAAKAKRARVNAKERQRKACYALVDAREGGLCRLTKRGGWLEHHHIVKRSQGGQHVTSNVVLLHKEIHDLVEARRIAVEGDADGALVFTWPDGRRQVSVPSLAWQIA